MVLGDWGPEIFVRLVLVAGLFYVWAYCRSGGLLRGSGGRMACGAGFAAPSSGLGVWSLWGCDWYCCSGLSVPLSVVVLIGVLVCACEGGIGSAWWGCVGLDACWAFLPVACAAGFSGRSGCLAGFWR